MRTIKAFVIALWGSKNSLEEGGERLIKSLSRMGYTPQIGGEECRDNRARVRKPQRPCGSSDYTERKEREGPEALWGHDRTLLGPIRERNDWLKRAKGSNEGGGAFGGEKPGGGGRAYRKQR